jgi:hypothetical protein
MISFKEFCSEKVEKQDAVKAEKGETEKQDAKQDKGEAVKIEISPEILRVIDAIEVPSDVEDDELEDTLKVIKYIKDIIQG